MNKHSWLVGVLAVVTAAGCGGKKDDALSFLSNHAVGTYIGGGSMFGADSCTYTGTDGVFVDDEGKPSATAEKGPRFVVGAGTITKDCGGTKSTVKAHVPTGAKITGPAKIKVGEKDLVSTMFKGVLVADGKELGGEANIEWQLGPDCTGVAEFGPVSGAQDTGGRDRSRTLVTTKAGTCTVTVGLQTGSALYESFKPQTFQAKQTVTVE